MYPHDCELCTLQANQAESFAIFTGNIENARSSRVGTKMNLFEFLYWKLPFFAWDALEKNMKNMWLINLCLYGQIDILSFEICLSKKFYWPIGQFENEAADH